MSGSGVTALLALLPGALICGTTVLWIGARFLRTFAMRNAVLLVAMLASIVRVDGTSLALYLRGITGDLSIATLVLLCTAAASLLVGRPLVSATDKRWLAAIFGAAALLLYPCALGLTAFDPYALGYRPGLLAIPLFVILAAAIIRERYLVALALLAAPLAFSLGVYESHNLWDYLLDPCLAVYTLSAGARTVLRTVRSLPHTSTQQERFQ